MRGLIGLCIVAFCAGLGIVVGYKMTPESLAVVTGVVCGVLASLPMALVILLAQRAANRRSEPTQPTQQPYPPVVVIQGGEGNRPPSLPQQGDVWSTPAGREFRMIGED